MPHRCILGCKNTNVIMHVFPNPARFPERFKAWVDLVNERLETPMDVDYFRKKRICEIHFIQEHKNRYKRLSAIAMPMLNLPGIPMSKTQNSDDSQPSSPFAASDVMDIQDSENRCRDMQTNTLNIEAAVISPDVMDLQDSENRCGDMQTSTSNIEAAVISPDVMDPQDSESQCGDLQTSTSNIEAAVISLEATVIKEHNYSVLSRSPQTSFIKGGPNSTAAYRFKQMKPLLTKIKYLRSEICRLHKNAKSFTERLANADTLSEDLAFQRIVQQVTKPAKLFIQMQIQTKKKATGRPFSINEKLLSLALFKKSPECYRLLSKIFILPSANAMKRLLSEIKVSTGINPLIFERIKCNLQYKVTSDPLCSLIFDEMSITPQINYNGHKDKLEDFTMNKENNFTNHTLVFMVKGIKGNFKQPVAYYFTNSLNKIELKTIIKTVIQECIKSGLVIVSSVCAQSQVNVGAITELVNDTKASFLRRQKEWHGDLIFIERQIIIPLYDTKHIIKGLRNNLICKDLVYYTTCNIKGIYITKAWHLYMISNNVGRVFLSYLFMLGSYEEKHRL